MKFTLDGITYDTSDLNIGQMDLLMQVQFAEAQIRFAHAAYEQYRDQLRYALMQEPTKSTETEEEQPSELEAPDNILTFPSDPGSEPH